MTLETVLLRGLFAAALFLCLGVMSAMLALRASIVSVDMERPAVTTGAVG